MSQKKYSILLADDHQLVLDGLSRIISSHEDLAVADTANSGLEALKILKLIHVDMVISDIEMPGMNGVELLKSIRKEYPQVKVIMLTMYKEPGLANEMIRQGTDGYILKTADQEEMINAIRTVLNGKKYLSPELAFDVNRNEIGIDPKKQQLEKLTSREVEILVLIAQGYSNKEIASKLFVSPKTIDTHRTNMMGKLEIHNVAGLTRFAIQNKLI